MEQTQIANIVNDLLKKFPAGPNGNYRRQDYDIERKYHSMYERYADIPVLRDRATGEQIDHFGYDPVDLFQMGIEDVHDAYSKCRELDPDASSMACRRRGNRLWYRIEKARKWVHQNGATGVYELRWGWSYSSPRAYVHANTHEEAMAVGLTLNGLFGAQPGEAARSTFIKVGAPVATLTYNNAVAQKIVKRAQSDLQDAEKMLEKARKGLEEAKARSELIITNAMMQANLHCEEEAA